MTNSNLGPAYNSSSVTKNAMYWWLGQVVDEEHWIGNEVLKNHKRDDAKGWGKRYRVRIFSKDSQIKDPEISTPDKQLSTASVLVPTTAGTGHGGYGETPVLAQGSFVMGFYLDGVEGKNPVIFGALPNNAQTRLLGEDPDEGFVPRSGYSGNTGNKKVATKDLHTEVASNETPAKESTSADGGVTDVRKTDQKKDGQEEGVRKKNIECEGGGGPVKGIQGFIQRALAVIKRIKETTNSFLNSASDIVDNISQVVNQTASFISSMFKLIVGQMRGYVLSKINAGIKDLGDQLPPNLRQVLSTGATTGTDTLSCVFQKIIAGLFALAKQLFLDFIDKYISAPMCAAEKFVGDMIGSILSQITDGINAFLASIQGLLGAVGDIVGEIFNVLDIITGVLNFLKCDATPNCDYRDRWSFWNGDDLADAVSDFLGSTLKAVSNGADYPGCNTDQLPCGPPSINFNGGGGTGLSGEAIVSLGGQLMGVDFSFLGEGYTSTPTVTIDDQCNTGGGGCVKLLTKYSGSEEAADDTYKSDPNGIEITGAYVCDPGADYIPTQTLTQTTINDDPTYTVVKNVPLDKGGTIGDPDTGNAWQNYPPGTTVSIPIQEYDPPVQVCLPPNTEVDVYDPDTGEVIQTISGKNQMNCNNLTSGGTFTTPLPPSSEGAADGDGAGITQEGVGDGDIVLEGVFIENSGANYNPLDEIVIEPNTGGATMSPVFDDGILSDVVITNPGSIFTEFPTIFIKSTTGVNASIIPVFKLRKATEDPDAGIVGQGIISVVDCIGRVINGYINGKPYYGPYHVYKGRKVVGGKPITDGSKRVFIYDTPEESLKTTNK